MKVLLQHGDEWLRFAEPVEILTARTPDEVFQCLETCAALITEHLLRLV